MSSRRAFRVHHRTEFTIAGDVGFQRGHAPGAKCQGLQLEKVQELAGFMHARLDGGVTVVGLNEIHETNVEKILVILRKRHSVGPEPTTRTPWSGAPH